MTIALTGSVTTITFNNGTPSGQYTPPAGTTKLGIALSYTDYDGRVTAVSLGGVSATAITGADAQNNTNNRANATQYYIDSPSLSAQTVAVTTGATWKDFAVVFYPFSGAKTGMPTKVGTDAHDASTNLNYAASPAVGDIVVAVASTDSGTTFGTWANSFTSDLNAVTPNSLGVFGAAHKTAAATTETANVQAAGGNVNRSAAMAVVVYESSAAGASSKLLSQLANQGGF